MPLRPCIVIIEQCTANLCSSLCRKVGETEMRQVLTTQKASVTQRPTNPVFAATSRSFDLSRATPSHTRVSLPSCYVPEIEATLLMPASSDSPIGSGRFGTCLEMVYKDMYTVCTKCFQASTGLDAIKSEAAYLLLLSNEYTPHCFGICKEKRAIIMSYITLSGKPVNFHNLLTMTPEGVDLTSHLAFQLLLDISKGLQFIHDSGILHNDLKLDNVVFGSSITKPLRAYIVDFGKACSVRNGKTYQLLPEDKALYKKEHTQIAPDLRDGHTAQSQATDIYSLGRVIKKANQTVIHSEEVVTFTKEVMSYYSCNRPSISHIISRLETFHLAT